MTDTGRYVILKNSCPSGYTRPQLLNIANNRLGLSDDSTRNLYKSELCTAIHGRYPALDKIDTDDRSFPNVCAMSDMKNVKMLARKNGLENVDDKGRAELCNELYTKKLDQTRPCRLDNGMHSYTKDELVDIAGKCGINVPDTREVYKYQLYDAILQTLLHDQGDYTPEPVFMETTFDEDADTPINPLTVTQRTPSMSQQILPEPTNITPVVQTQLETPQQTPVSVISPEPTIIQRQLEIPQETPVVSPVQPPQVNAPSTFKITTTQPASTPFSMTTIPPASTPFPMVPVQPLVEEEFEENVETQLQQLEYIQNTLNELKEKFD